MGRKKHYNRELLTEKAMEIFRDHGFAGTSAEMLVQGLGVNRYSLYSEFGSKQGLFDAALQRYDEVVVARNFGPLEAPGAGIAEIRALLEFFGSAGDGAASGRGCLLCNTAVEFGPDDPSGAGFVQRYFKRLAKAFRRALVNAHRAGDLDRHRPEPAGATPDQGHVALAPRARAAALGHITAAPGTPTPPTYPSAPWQRFPWPRPRPRARGGSTRGPPGPG